MANVVIFAGGTGTRMGNTSVPKQFLDYGGKPLIVHTIEHFQQHPQVERVAVAVPEEWIPRFEEMVTRFALTKIVGIVGGGSTGQESIYLGLKAIVGAGAQPDEIVMIHDGVRPLINERIITECIEVAQVAGGAITVFPAVETVVYSENGTSVEGIHQRDKLYIAQAPQGFPVGELLAAHEEARARNELDYIDSCTMMLELRGLKSSFVMGSRANMKVTAPEDYYMSRALLELEHFHEVDGA